MQEVAKANTIPPEWGHRAVKTPKGYRWFPL